LDGILLDGELSRIIPAIGTNRWQAVAARQNSVSSNGVASDGVGYDGRTDGHQLVRITELTQFSQTT